MAAYYRQPRQTRYISVITRFMKMAGCKYHRKEYDYLCGFPALEPDKYCIFHSEDYLKGDNYEKNKELVKHEFNLRVIEPLERLHTPLWCIGYYLPDISCFLNFSQSVHFNLSTFYGKPDFSGSVFEDNCYFRDVTFRNGADFESVVFSGKADFSRAKFLCSEVNFSKSFFLKEARFPVTEFSRRVDFSQITFLEEAFFLGAEFDREADFYRTIFKDRVYFSGEFNGETRFWYTIFEQPAKVTFDMRDMSRVSFADSDITRIRFGDKVTWGGKDRFTILEEQWLRNGRRWQMSLNLALSVYRNLRENYEFRLRYDEAGKFFVKEMDLKRDYNEGPRYSAKVSKLIIIRNRLLSDFVRLIALRHHKHEKGNLVPENPHTVTQNNWLKRNFSLTGLYSHLSTYGESIGKPTLIGIIIVLGSTLFWITWNNPTLEPNLFFLSGLNPDISTDFIGFAKIGDLNQWVTASQRSIIDFIPLLPQQGNFKIGLVDYIIKIIGGVLTFGLIIIALRRKFERKYTR